MKRQAEHQMTKDDEKESDDDDEKEVQVGIPRASPEELQHRRIVKPKVPTTSFGTATGFKGFGQLSTNSSASGFGGFGSTTTTTTTTSTTGGGGFGGFAAAAAASKDGGVKGFAFTTTTTTTKDDSEESKEQASPTPPAQSILPDHYELVKGEEDEDILWEQRAKTYRWVSTTPTTTTTTQPDATTAVPSATTFQKNESPTTESTWKEVGVGPLKVLQHKTTKHCRIVQRRQTDIASKPTKVILNVSLQQHAQPLDSEKGGKGCKLAAVEDGQPVQFAFKLKLEQDAQELYQILKECCPSGKEEEETNKKETTTSEDTKEESTSKSIDDTKDNDDDDKKKAE